MSELSFDGRVAVVTGAGRGLGRAYALLLAERGASVVVNDLGGSMEGTGADAGPAAAVVDQIAAAGGTALADTSDVATVDGRPGPRGRGRRALRGLDVLVNNAGIIRWAGLPEVDAENLARHLAVHIVGSFNTARAAWPHMAGADLRPDRDDHVERRVRPAEQHLLRHRQGGGDRPDPQPGHGGAEARHPREPASPRRPSPAWPEPTSGAEPTRSHMAPELVAPMAAYLAHESCPVNGEMYAAGAGRFARIFLATTPGYVRPGDDPRSRTSPRTGRRHATTKRATRCPRDLSDWSAGFLSHLPPARARLTGDGRLLVEEVGLLGHDLVVERLELVPAGAVAPVCPAVFSATSGRIGIGVPAASASSCAWHVRSMVMNHHAASSTVWPTVRSPWLARMAALLSPSAWAMRLPSSGSTTAPV